MQEATEIKIRLPRYFADKMVLQQACVNLLQGQLFGSDRLSLVLERFPADPEDRTEDVQYGIVFEDVAETQPDGFFSFHLPAFEASFDRYRLSLRVLDEVVVIDDILFGEVWLSLGESNMSMPAKLTDLAPNLGQISELSYLRIFTQTLSGLAENDNFYSAEPVGRIPGGHWLTSTDIELAEISGLALSFADFLYRDLKTPLAIYNLAAGDSMIHSWLPRPALESKPKLRDLVDARGFYRNEENWNKREISLTARQRQLRADNFPDAANSFKHKFANIHQPSTLFNHKLAPYSGLSVRGFLWYQGESDALYPNYYIQSLKLLVENLKANFTGPGTGPVFIFSQLSTYFYDSVNADQLALFNEALAVARRQLSLNSGLVTVYDLDCDYNSDKKAGLWARPINPVAKSAIGYRMYRLALGLAYGRDLPSSAPECAYAEKLGNKLMISFENTGKGLYLREGEVDLKGFLIRAEDGPYVPAQAKDLYGVRALVWHDEIENPVACSYAFQSFNQDANLLANNNMPVLPFRLEKAKPGPVTYSVWTACDSLVAWQYPVKSIVDDQEQVGLPAYYPIWDIWQGEAKLNLEKHNKRTGKNSLYLSYNKADLRPIIFGPVLGYASMYPPTDLSSWKKLSLDLFNADHHVKSISLSLRDRTGAEYNFPAQTISEELVWQTIHFNLEETKLDLSKLTMVLFNLNDRYKQGGLFIDRVALTGLTTDHKEVD